MNTTLRRFLTLFLAGLIMVLAGCGGGESPSAPEAAPEPVVSSEELTPVEAPTVDEGLIAYVSGVVDIAEGGQWYPAQIGDFITPANNIKTGPGSSCEIQFGSTAVIRLQENTEIDISRINLTPEASKVGLEMVAGEVLAKVQKLSGSDSFSVKTQSAVCGVRGTEFSVSTGDGTGTVIAVREGSVAVLPPALDVEELKDQVAEKGAAAGDSLDKLLEDAPRVEANQELTLGEEFVEETREIAETVTNSVREIAAAQSEEEIIRKTENLSATAAASTVSISEKSDLPREISAAKAETLKQTDKMKILPIPVSATRDSKASRPEIRLYKIGLKVQPSDASISIDGEPVGAGNFSALYEEGRSISFTISRKGYAPYQLPVSVSPESAKLYTVQMAALKVEEPEPEPEPEPAAAPAPEPVPVSEAAPEPEPQAVQETEQQAQAPPAETPAEVIAAEAVVTAAAGEKPVEAEPVEAEPVEAKPLPVKVVINTEPRDARISIDGREAGRGSAQYEALPGTRLEVSVIRRGFAPQKLSVEVGESPVNRRISLEARPVVFSSKAAKEAIIGLTASEGIFVSSSAKGALSAVNRDGRVLWSIDTANSPNENSTPVVIGNKVFFSGAKQLVTAGLHQGNQVETTALDSNRSHLFGRRVVPFQGKVLFPANSALEILHPENGSFSPFALLEGPGSRMTPGVYGDKVLIVDQQGLFIVFNADGTLHSEVPTGAVQPIALAVAVNRDSAVFSGRRGDTAAVDLATTTVRWERTLSDGSISVSADILAAPEGAYAFSRDGTIYALNWQNGADLFTPIRGAATPPAYADGTIIYGTRDGKLVIASAATGTTRRSLSLNSQPTTRPVLFDGMIAVGTRDGQVILIEPEGIR
jgi:outer membrane protein assembly factor BamB